MPDPTEAEMKSALQKRSRFILNLGKYRVIERTDAAMKLALGGSTTMTITLPPHADVKAGDLLTLYTEVLYAKPEQSPVQ